MAVGSEAVGAILITACMLLGVCRLSPCGPPEMRYDFRPSCFRNSEEGHSWPSSAAALMVVRRLGVTLAELGSLGQGCRGNTGDGEWVGDTG